MRIAITTLLWKEANQILNLYHNKKPKTNLDNLIKSINFAEEEYSHTLLEKISQNKLKQIKIPEAQIVFCIDVRSEPFRLCLEKTGKYETFGYAGFFGIPAKIKNTINNEYYNSCPVLLSPKHLIKKTIFSDKKVKLRHYFFLTELKKLYQSVKYNFTTPFALVESIGIFNGLFIWLRNFFPNLAYKIGFGRNEDLINNSDYDYLIDNIKFEDKCQYAESALKMIGLTKNFAKLVVFCGHVGCTQNNAYASSLDCGACAGRNGSNNSNILVKILNDFSIRKFLSSKGYKIPDTTVFIAGEHNTTTDQVTLMTSSTLPEIQALKANLEKARIQNNISRLKKLGHNVPKNKALKHALKNSQDWSQVRPEWGLANNAAFIIGPRNYTDSIDLDGRCFLHSYDYTNDIDGQILTNILTAPMVVAQWINSQYLFSSLNNVTYGGGSKITKNITGKIGIMQGNASDLMTGLSLQSVYSSDLNKYHTTQRLITVVFASRLILKKIIKSQFVLQKLFGNGWVKLICIEPDTKKTYFLNRDYSWKMYN